MPTTQELGFFGLRVFLDEDPDQMTLNIWAGDSDGKATTEDFVAQLSARSKDRVDIMVEIVTKLIAAIEASKPTITVTISGKNLQTDDDFTPSSKQAADIKKATVNLKGTLDDLSAKVDKLLPPAKDVPKKP